MKNMSNEAEVWKPIAGYEGLYDVSNHGRVRSYHVRRGRNSSRASNETFRMLTAVADTNGHMKVTLCRNRVHVSHFISRLVAAAFLAVPPVYFLDGDRTNLAADNIRYCSRAESKRHTKGGNGGGSGKLDSEQVRQIREKYEAGEPCRGRYRKRTVTYLDLSREYGVGVSTISHIMNRVTHR